MKIRNCFIIFIFLCFCFLCVFESNSYDVLPLARQIYNPNWLASDWYLNSAPPFRLVFNFFIGFFYDLLGFDNALLTLRLLSFGAFSIIFVNVLERLNLNITFGLMSLAIFSQFQYLVVKEWLFPDFEGKVFSTYLFLTSSLLTSSINRKKMVMSWGLLGLSLTVHAALGLFYFFTHVTCVLLSPKLRSMFLRTWHWNVLAYFIGLSPFILLFLHGFLGEIPVSDEMKEAALKTLIFVRLPHHLDPLSWDWALFGLKLTLSLAVIFIYVKSSRPNELVTYYLHSAIIFGLFFVLGLAAYASESYVFVTLTPFRAFDFFIPFLASLLFTMHIQTRLSWNSRFFQLISWVVLFLVMVSAVWRQTGKDDLPRAYSDDIYFWVRENTDRNAIFLINPAGLEFYVKAERAPFVTFKHIPLSITHIQEWSKRITLVNGGKIPQNKGFSMVRELEDNFRNMTSTTLEAVRKEYCVDFVLSYKKFDSSSMELLFKSPQEEFVYSLEELSGCTRSDAASK